MSELHLGLPPLTFLWHLAQGLRKARGIVFPLGASVAQMLGVSTISPPPHNSGPTQVPLPVSALGRLILRIKTHLPQEAGAQVTHMPALSAL